MATGRWTPEWLTPTRFRMGLMGTLLAGVALSVTLISLASLYRVAIEVRRESLAQLAAQRAALIAALEDGWEDPEQVLEVLRDDRLELLGLGETGEFALGRRSGDRIQFLLRQRHGRFDSPLFYSDADRADPMRRALSGESGTAISRDYRDVPVLAAYQPIADTPWGIVAKMDLAEVRAPFVRTGLMTFAASGVLVLLAGWAFVRTAEPVVRTLQESEEGLRVAVADLERSNAELEQFAYVASHDLQEPLRMVVSYLRLLEQRLGPDLPQDQRKFLDYAVDGGKRMQRLIADLLFYSRTGSRGEPFTQVDLGVALQTALGDLRAALEEAGATVEATSLPTVEADPVQMTQLFQNLVGNAVKFRGQAPPRIRVWAEDLGESWRVAVADNGLGVPPEHSERIFEIFQRLHSRSAYPGTGLGLAVCRRIVHRHGGEIRVTSQPGEGSTFYFTLPAKKERGHAG